MSADMSAARHSNSAPTPSDTTQHSARHYLQHCVKSPVRATMPHACAASLQCACVLLAQAASLRPETFWPSRTSHSVHRCEFCVHLVNQFGQALAARRNAKLVGSLGGNFGHRLCPCQILPVGVRRNADGDSFFVNLLSDTRGVFYFSSSAFFVPAMLQRRVRTIISPYCHPIL